MAGAYSWYRRRAHEPKKSAESIVLLLRAPAKIDNRLLAHLFSEESGKQVDAIAARSDSSTENFVMGGDDATRFVAVVGQTMFVTYSMPKPYGDKTVVAQGTKDVRLRDAIEQHNAWMSIDFADPAQATPENYRLIARVLSHFADENCLALYHPRSNTMVVRQPETVAALRASDPINSTFLSPTVWLDPGKGGDDPRLIAAEAEARRRFPEFERAFEAKGNRTFFIKSRFTSGEHTEHTEHMWSEVEHILPDKITGKLAGDPDNLPQFKKGDDVSISRDAVEDWAILSGDQTVGAFTDPVVQQIQKEHAAK
jgi:uncharacterized protein YegJ (DUF2314 family)